MSVLARHRFAVAMIALVALVVFAGPLLRGEVFTFRDHTDYFQPLRHFTSQQLRAGVLPLWNPYNASGEPWLANPQTGVFYPPTWLFVVLPFPAAYMLHLLMHLLIAGWSSYALFVRRASSGAAMVGAVAVMLCGPTLSLLDVSNNLATFAWIPLVLWCALERPRVPRFVCALVLTLAFLGGEPFFAAIAATLFSIIVLVCADDRRRALLDVAIVGLGALGLSAVQLFPFLEMLRGSDRTAGFTPQQIFSHSMKLGDWLRIGIPPHVSANGYDAALSQHFIPVIYVGIAVTLLAVAAWVLAIRRREAREVAAWSTLIVVCALIAAGKHLPLGEWIAQLPLTLFRYPARVVPIAALGVIALAVFAWERIRPDKRWLDLMLVLLIVGDVLPRAMPLLQSGPFRTDRVPYGTAVGRAAKIVRLPNPTQSGAALARLNRPAWISGYLNLYERRFDTGTAAPVTAARHSALHERAIVDARIDLINILSGGFVLTDRTLVRPELRPIARAGDVTVYSNPVAMPIATMWSGIFSAADDDDALRATLEGRFVAGKIFIPNVSDARLLEPPVYVRSVEMFALNPSNAYVTVETPRPAVVVITQQDAPGWRVRVNGIEREKLLANGVFRAVAVPAGRHEIAWNYRPRSLLVGASVTLLTLVAGCIASVVVKRISARNFSSVRIEREV